MKKSKIALYTGLISSFLFTSTPIFSQDINNIKQKPALEQIVDEEKNLDNEYLKVGNRLEYGFIASKLWFIPMLPIPAGDVFMEIKSKELFRINYNTKIYEKECYHVVGEINPLISFGGSNYFEALIDAKTGLPIFERSENREYFFDHEEGFIFYSKGNKRFKDKRLNSKNIEILPEDGIVKDINASTYSAMSAAFHVLDLINEERVEKKYNVEIFDYNKLRQIDIIISKDKKGIFFVGFKVGKENETELKDFGGIEGLAEIRLKEYECILPEDGSRLLPEKAGGVKIGPFKITGKIRERKSYVEGVRLYEEEAEEKSKPKTNFKPRTKEDR